MAHLISNTSKDYPCTLCGSLGNIVREDPTNPRLKCNSCGFMYDANDSIAAKEAGSIPDGPPILPEAHHAETVEPETYELVASASDKKETRLPLAVALPRNPSHVILSKNRKEFDFITEKSFKKKILEWEAAGKGYDVYQLMKFEYTVKVDVKN